MTLEEALQWADTFGPIQSDPPGGDAPALLTLAAEVRRLQLPRERHPMTTAQHLDAALEHLRAIGHGHEADELTRRHIEYASAHIREAWIADDGQNARTPDLTHKAVAGFFRLQDKLEAMTAPVPLCK